MNENNSDIQNHTRHVQQFFDGFVVGYVQVEIMVVSDDSSSTPSPTPAPTGDLESVGLIPLAFTTSSGTETERYYARVRHFYVGVLVPEDYPVGMRTVDGIDHDGPLISFIAIGANRIMICRLRGPVTTPPSRMATASSYLICTGTATSSK